MKTLKEYIYLAQEKKIAIGHFNISTIDTLWAIVRASKKKNVPVIIGVSEGERDFLGVKEVRALVDSIKTSTGHPVFLNADHTYSLERVKEAVEGGYDAVIFDGSELSLSENITKTKECVDYVRSTRPEVFVEGELGYIGKSSKMLEEIPEGVGSIESMTKPNEAEEFVAKTGIDLLSPAVGNIHGMLKNMPNPRLNISLIRQLSAVSKIPLVLHGGSGISAEDFKAGIAQGISIVHINTELRKAWRETTEKFLQENPDEVAPYKVLSSASQAVEVVVAKNLEIFN